MSTHPHLAPQMQMQAPRSILNTFNPLGMPQKMEYIFAEIPKPGAHPHQFDMADVEALPVSPEMIPLDQLNDIAWIQGTRKTDAGKIIYFESGKGKLLATNEHLLDVESLEFEFKYQGRTNYKTILLMATQGLLFCLFPTSQTEVLVWYRCDSREISYWYKVRNISREQAALVNGVLIQERVHSSSRRFDTNFVPTGLYYVLERLPPVYSPFLNPSNPSGIVIVSFPRSGQHLLERMLESACEAASGHSADGGRLTGRLRHFLWCLPPAVCRARG